MRTVSKANKVKGFVDSDTLSRRDKVKGVVDECVVAYRAKVWSWPRRYTLLVLHHQARTLPSGISLAFP